MALRLVLPDIGEGVVEAEVVKWLVAPGDEVAEDQPLLEVMTDKATVTIPAPHRGRVVRLLVREGEVARVHQALLELEAEPGASATPPPDDRPRAPESGGGPKPDAPPAPAQAKRRAGAKPLAAPAVRALARRMGVDLATVTGSGPDGRILREDLSARGAPPKAAGPAAASGPAPAPPGPVEVVPLRGVRRKIAENMARSLRTAAHFTLVEQVDVTELTRVKERLAGAGREQGVKVTFLPFVVKAVVAALKRHPYLNSSLDEERGEIHLKRWYDVGIASATDQGLLVPVIRRADQRSLADLAREIERLSTEARAGRARPEDQGGSTFTITSLGALGGLFATPVINHPEVAILGVHRIRPTPVAKDGAVVIRDVMYLSLSFDHRVVDGHVGAAFAYDVIGTLEDPSLLFLEMV
jgi:pyruvate dehydrogenase E2 component (dihydrolipoamide acetyltransferase)